MFLNGILAIFVAYLIGSLPTAYIVTRLRTGKDIRTLGSGNVGAHNVYEYVGMLSAIVTGIIDIAKGITAVIVAEYIILNQVVLGTDLSFRDDILLLMGVGLAAVIGHMWPVFLKFKGGNGVSTTIGILLIIMTQEVLIAIAIAILILTITRNPVFSIYISLIVTIPIAGGLMQEEPWLYVGFALILFTILVVNFIPTMRAALATAGSKEQLAADIMRIKPDKLAKSTNQNKRKKRK